MGEAFPNNSTPPPAGRYFNLRFHEWFLAHKFELFRWWVVLLLLVDTVIVFYLAVRGLGFAAEAANQERRMISTIQGLAPAEAVSAVRVEAPSVVWAGATTDEGESMAYVALVRNPNSDWLAEVDINFLVKGSVSVSATTSIRPGQDQYVVAAKEATSGSSTEAVSGVVAAVRWQRITDPNQRTSIDFSVEGITYEPASVAPNTGLVFSRVTASVTNRSIYGFWSVDVPVVVKEGDRLVAVKTLSLRSFKAGDVKTVEAQWLRKLPPAASVEIKPAVDLLDEANFMNRP